MALEVRPTNYRKCKDKYTVICMKDIEGLGASAGLLWVILCHKWDLIKHKPHSAEEAEGWVTVTRKTLAMYGVGKNVFGRALKKLEAENRVYVRRHSTRAVRVKMKTANTSEASE